MTFKEATCKNCSHNNPPYLSICEKCKSYLRERVVNLDLWETIRLMIEEPDAAFKQIIFSEHKNFIVFLALFIAVKNLIIIRFISVPQLGKNGVVTSFIVSLLLSIVFTFAMFSLTAFIQKKILNKKAITLRFKDYLSLNIYSMIPYLFGLFLIFPVELTVLGGDIFSNNPYSFQIKPIVVYTLIGFEFLIILWSLFLFFRSNLLLTQNKQFAIIITATVFILWSISLYIQSLFIFIL